MNTHSALKMLTVKNNKKRVYFHSENLEEALLQSEALVAENVERYVHTYEVNEKGHSKRKTKIVSKLDWHMLVTRFEDHFHHHPIISVLSDWGLELDQETLNRTNNVLVAKRKKYYLDLCSCEMIKKSRLYTQALDMIEKAYNKPLKDGRKIFDYQKEGAALMIARKRLILAYDMGLGKTMTALVALTSDPTNKKILIITMSRNINDWIREIKVLGLENDYILLNNPRDVHSDKRIHIVSYERWSKDYVIYRFKKHEKCPECGSIVSFNRNLQYCKICKKSFRSNIRYSANDLPENCPSCYKEWKKGEHFCNCGFSVIELRKKALSSYFHRGYDACVVDEAHYLKNGKSKRAKSVVRKVKTKKRFALTGTPAENGAEDLFWPLVWLMGDTHVFEDPYELRPFEGYGNRGEEHFRQYYGGGSKRAVFDSDSIMARVSNTYSLWNLLDTVMIRKTKQDKDVEESIRVPKPIHRRIHLTLEEADRQLYDHILEKFREWYQMELFKKEQAEIKGDTYRISTIQICTWMDKLRKAASCPWDFEEYDISLSSEPTKVRFLKEKVKEYGRRGKKMLVFTAHKKTAEDLGVLLDGILPGQEAAYIHGSVDMDYRFQLMERFQDPNDPLSVLVMTMRTGAESYTLTEAKAVFLYDLDFNAKKIEQCYSRAVRLGQKDVVDIYWLIAVDTIDANMHALILSKQSGVDLAIDRKELDFQELSKQFEGDGNLGLEDVDMEKFAAEMLGRGTKRQFQSA